MTQSPVTQPPATDKRSFLLRLLTTSLGDLLRGRVNGALDSWHVIKRANLPDALKTTIRRTVNRSSWRLAPRIELARRLVVDFEAQLADGHDVQELRESLTQPRRNRRWLRRPRPDALLTVTLPAELQKLVTTVVRKTRLSRNEQLDVCRELCEHFRDGLAAGESPDKLARAFGDVAPAARLIRRAKIRNRSWRRQLLTYTVRAAQISVAAGVLFWCFQAVRYFGSEPNITRNYLAEMDAAFVDIPAEESAWPLYREALMDLTPGPGEWPIWDETGVLQNDVRRYVAENQHAVELSREAATMPRMGFSFQDRDNGEWLAHEGYDGETIESFFTPDGPLIGSVLRHLQEMAVLCRLLAADAWVAADRGDAVTVEIDLGAMLAMSDHVRDTHAFIVTEVISLSLVNVTTEHTGRLLEQYPDLLDDEQLQQLAASFDESLDRGQIVINLDGERAMVADTLQRVYSDNGDGNGYVTQQGMKIISAWTPRNQGELWTQSSTPARTVALIAEPLAASRIASRREVCDLVDELFADAAIQSRRPRWLRESVDDHPDFVEVRSGTPGTSRWLPLTAIMPSFDGLLTCVDHAKQNREATLTVIALHRYHRQHDTWPETLAALVPDFLPAEPIDQANGQPLRYRLEDGQPWLYSVGLNGTDDGGIRSNPEYPGLHIPDGDWVLWPPADPVAD